MFREAADWIKRHSINAQCLPISNRQNVPYPEVTGYCIPTLLEVGEHELAKKFAQFLITIQNPDGSFSAANTSNEKFVFDTGQVIRGWVAIAPRLPEVLEPLRRACDWIVKNADSQTGRFIMPKPGGLWNLGPRGEVSEGIHLYVIQPLREAAELLNTPHIRKAADRALNYYLDSLELTRFETPNALTHFYGYIQEALFETGCADLAIAGMCSAAKFQQSNGAVPAYHDVTWICAPGLAQLAKVWFLLEEKERGQAALVFSRNLQNYTGGFYGSYGVRAGYFPAEEISWAAKFFIDAELLSIQSHFNNTSNLYSTTISEEDGRAHAVLANVSDARKILDVGCGKGRYATLLKSHFPNRDIYAVDISEEMMLTIPNTIQTRKASIQNIPFNNDTFDLVYCVEALEHAPNPAAAIEEMARLVRPGGRLIIVDKNREKLGALKIEQWENWFGGQALADIMSHCGLDTTFSEISYDNKAADGLFLCWKGIKRLNF